MICPLSHGFICGSKRNSKSYKKNALLVATYSLATFLLLQLTQTSPSHKDILLDITIVNVVIDTCMKPCIIMHHKPYVHDIILIIYICAICKDILLSCLILLISYAFCLIHIVYARETLAE